MLPTSQDVQNSKPSNELSKSDIMFINAVCSWTGKPFDCIGDAFIEMFFRKRTALAVGSAIVTVLGEYDDLSLQQQRLILLYLLYRIDELEVLSGEKAVFPGDKSESVLYHPFLAVFLSLMTLPKDAFIGKDLAVGFSFSLPHITPQEKHMLGCLLTGKTSQVNPLTPFEFAKLPIVNENYDLSRHRAALELQQHSFPLLALVSIPSVLKAPDGNFRVRSGDEFDGILDALNELLTGHDPAMSCSVLPPPFHRLIPALMPPSDDEFQFLYPFQLEPLWMENGSAVFSESNPAEASLSNEMASVSGLCGVSDEVCNVQSESSSIDDEGVMVLKSGDEFENKDEITKSDVTAVSPHFHHERKPLERAEVIELLVKSLECRIGDCQRVAEAIAADPSIAEVTFDLPIEKFPRFIDDNATIASAVIYERVMKDPTSLETFFNIINDIGLSVKAMEVVNKLCAAANELSKKVSEAGDLTIREAVSSVPTYLNTYIIRCISACGEPDHCNSTQYRQVRMLCVFISTLIRNRALEIQPLSSELKSFCLSFSFVKEALSLYKTII